MEEFIDLNANGKEIMKKLLEISKKDIYVGYIRGVKESDGTDLVDIAYMNEYGTSNIPARPFMRQSLKKISDNTENIGKIVKKCIKKSGDVESALNSVGVTAKGIIQKEFIDGDFIPNAPSTVARKKSDRPLIDTGTLRQNVTYVIREREDK